MTQKKAIFFDIDGTLLNSKKEIPASTKKAVYRLQEFGHEVAIATGRGPFMFEELRKELNIDTYVSFNGQYVVVKGEVVHSNPLHPDSLRKLTETALDNNHPVVFMDQHSMKANVPEHPFVTESLETLKLGFQPGHDPNYHHGRELYQSLLFCEEGEENQYEQVFKDFDFIRWHPYSMDILPKGGSKAIGIQKAAEKLDVVEENLFAFGDGLNDIEMLTTVPNSVAMGNGVDEAKAVAKYVTKSVEEDGILHGLQLVGLL